MRLNTNRFIKLFPSVTTKTLRIQFTCICCLVFSLLSFGQIKFERLSANKYLSSKHINDIVQDSNGFLIIATNNGLYNFDGYSMKKFRYDPSDSTALNEIVFTEIYKDSKENIWIGGNDLYFFNKDRGNFTRYYCNTEERINAILEYDQDNLIIVTTKIGIFNTSSKKYKELELSNPIDKIHSGNGILDKDKCIWIVDKRNRLYRVKITDISDPGLLKAVPYLHDQKVTCIYQSDSSNILLGTLNGTILEYNKSKDEFNELKEPELQKNNQEIKKLYIDKYGILWIISKDILYSYNNESNTLNFNTENVNDPNSLISNKINCFYEDKYGVLWIGTNNGISNVNPNTRNISYLYKKSDKIDDIPSNYIYSMYKDDKDFLWLSGDNCILSVNPVNHSIKRYLSDPADRKRKQILFKTCADHIIGYKNFLLTGGIGLNKIDFENGIYQYAHPEKGVETSIPGWNVKRIIKGKEPGLFMLITNGGIAKVTMSSEMTAGVSKMKEKFYTYILDTAHPEIINSYLIWDAFEDKNGWLWIGTDRGLFSFDPGTKNLVKYPVAKGTRTIQNYNVCNIYEDRNGNIWIGTEGFGLNKLEKESGFLKNITIFPRDVAWGILEDRDENLWISTNKGLFKYNPVTENIRLYNETDGLLNEEFIRYSYYKDNEGKMYFGSIGGMISFFPEEIEKNNIAPDISINELLIYNKHVNVDEKINGCTVLSKPLINTNKIHLSYKHKVISIGFSGIHLQSPENNRFAYFLEGFDIGWTYTNADIRKANYTNLPAGNYKFKVKAANADGIWSKEKVLLISVHPPFWKTWLFRILIFLIVLTSIISFYYIRIKQIKARNILLEKLVAKRTMEIEAQSENLKEINILLKERNEEVICQADELSQLNATKDKFFSIISHDLKNPFQAISGLSDALIKEYGNLNKSRIKEFISMIRESSESASNLLQNLLLWSRNQSNSIDFNPVLFDLHEIVADNFTLLKLNAQKKKLLLENKIAHKSYLFADKNMMHTVIRNLVNNAIKYTPEGGAISISSENKNDQIVIYVKDNGIGMSEELSSKLFRIDKQVSLPGTSGETGTGLGLIICKEFIEKNNGKIHVESKVNNKAGGTTFIIQLPEPPKDIIPEKDHKKENKSEKIDTNVISIQKENVNDEKPLILAVDDDENIRASIFNYYAQEYTVLVSHNGKDALDKAILECPDIIISDVNMPEMNGLDLCEKLKSDERTSHIPVILLTANIGETPTIKGFETGADDYITKPFNLKVLAARVKNLLDSRKKLRELYSKQFPEITKISGVSVIDQQFLDKVHYIINENISNPDFNAEALADKTAMSRQNLYRKMKALTNYTVHEYIKLIRLKKAAEILKKEAVSVSEVAIMVGFNDRTYFSTSFKKLFGKSPSDFR